MQSRADLPLYERRRFLTGRPCLDLVHTGGEGTYAAWELVHSHEDLQRWLGVILGIDGIRASSRDVSAMRRLRTAITGAAHSAVVGQLLARTDVAAINAVASTPPLVPMLNADGTSTVAKPTAVAALSTIARDAIDLFSGPLARRIRICAAPDCGLFFVDASRPGRRRWCSMQRCGNLAKVRDYRRRHVSAQPEGSR